MPFTSNFTKILYAIFIIVWGARGSKAHWDSQCFGLWKTRADVDKF